MRQSVEPERWTQSNNRKVERALEDWADQLFAEGWTPYLLTFKFEQMPGSDAARLQQMFHVIERVYSIHLTRLITRFPKKPSAIPWLPRWLLAVDRPVFKHEKKSLRDVLPNDGSHVQGVGFYYPRQRLPESLDDHFLDNRSRYITEGSFLTDIDVRPITHNPGYVLGYTRKTVRRRGDTSANAELILPRSWSEPTRRE